MGFRQQVLASGRHVDGLRRAEQRNREQPADDAAGRHSHERGDHRRGRCQVHRPPDDHRLQDVVLDLLVREVDDEADDAGQRRCA